MATKKRGTGTPIAQMESGAERAKPVHDNVADLAGTSCQTGTWLSTEHDSAADSGANADIE